MPRKPGASRNAGLFSSSVSYALVAIPRGGLGNGRAAREYLNKMAERWPLLAEDPRAAFEIHQPDPAVIDMIVKGLARARRVPLQ